MYIVKYVENGEEKQERIDGREEAFAFQAGILARRKRNEDGTWNIEPRGIWSTNTIR